MGSFWQSNVIEAGKLPLLLCVIAFVSTFVVTRIIVRAIRAGRGPFKDNTVGGVHIHHVVPGLFLMIVGGLVAIGAAGGGWETLAGILFGMGLALVLDEFALILHLDDVYWSEQGRLSVDVVFLLAAVMVCLLVVGSPFGVAESETGGAGRIISVALIALGLSCAVIAAIKGKLVTAVIGVLVPIVALIGAVRIARPNSPWAKRRYVDGSAKQKRAVVRELVFARRWRAKVLRVQETVAGVFGPVD